MANASAECNRACKIARLRGPPLDSPLDVQKDFGAFQVEAKSHLPKPLGGKRLADLANFAVGS